MFTLPPLPYEFNALEPVIDAKTMEIHHDKHHGTYVKNLNDALSGSAEFLEMDIEQLLAKLDAVPANVRVKVRNNGGGHANHSLFWTIMAPAGRGGAGEPAGDLAKAIDASFGSFSAFKDAFSQAALARFGSGWVWVVTDGGKLVIVDTPNQDSPLMEGKTPILGLDVWEHAYYLSYQNMRADYVKAWWSVVNWTEVGRRLSVLK